MPRPRDSLAHGHLQRYLRRNAAAEVVEGAEALMVALVS